MAYKIVDGTMAGIKVIFGLEKRRYTAKLLIKIRLLTVRMSILFVIYFK
jgi:hypothetical protein